MTLYMVVIFIVGLLIGLYMARYIGEGFQNNDMCDNCSEIPCKCSRPWHPASNKECKQPNMSNYVLKSSIPPCPALPDMSNYILKSECPPVPDLSNYVLKSSIPKQHPVILDCSKCNKPKGECPPCPRPRCPDVVCPTPVKCPACAPCPRTKCPPPTTLKCREEIRPPNDSIVRPYLAPLNYQGFGTN
jgi:hypothetical protein